MSSSNLMISVHGLSKSYKIRHNEPDHITVAELTLHRLRHPFHRTRTEDFWALRDLNFDVHRGEVLGLIGRNGSGKSTLLKLISRITEPTKGRIDLWGRVGSLLEVGTGFHPELTGRENIFLNGSLLGMTRREITKQFDAIVDFAGVARFLDTPVKRYSSGMYVRLAFGVAAHLDTDILLLDEVLAVGDADFQLKCMAKVRELATNGRTVVLVSHNPQVVGSVAHRTLLLRSGAVEQLGRTPDVLAHYRRIGREIVGARDLSSAVRSEPALGTRARFLSVAPLLSSESFTGAVSRYKIAISSAEPFDGVVLSYSVHAEDGTKLGSTFSEPISLEIGEANHFEVTLSTTLLAPGRYQVGLGLGLGDQTGNTTFLDVVNDATDFEVSPRRGRTGMLERWDSGWGPIQFPKPTVSRLDLLPSSISEQAAEFPR